MSWVQTDWDQRLIRAASARPVAAPDPRMQRLKDEGFTHAQIALMLRVPRVDVNIALGPECLKGRAA